MPHQSKGQEKRTSNFHSRVGRELSKQEGVECHLNHSGASKKV